ncbi:MAG: hypothetical protein NVS9B6_13000 [Candidatus Limnocylindrales bacterium]
MLGRARQTWRVVRAGGSADERHATRTAELLRAGGADAELIQAGLWHDIAKPTETRLWHRIAAVLLDRGAPWARRRLARGSSVFARYLDHPRRGADLAAARGASLRVVTLIAEHHETPHTADAALLARADREALP